MNRSRDGHERRSHRRYAIEAEVRYRIARQGRPVQEGTGYVINLSTGGVLFEAQDALPVGIEIELFIPWPSDRHSTTRSMLCITGKIVRVERKQVAVEILHYAYRLECDEPVHSERPLLRTGS